MRSDRKKSGFFWHACPYRLWAVSVVCLVMLAWGGVPGNSAWADEEKGHFFFDVRPQEVTEALKEIATQTGYQLLFSAEQTGSLTSKPLSGRYTIEEALSVLLQGTGLSSEITARGVIVIKKYRPKEAGEGIKMKMKNRLLSSVIGSLIGMGGIQGAATAQTQDAEGAQRVGQSMRVLEEVVVTARRREESAQSVPISMTALDAGTLETFKIENLEDLQYFDPSFTVSSSSGRANAPVYGLRGVRPTEAVAGQDPTVAIYLADVVLSPSKGSNLGMYDLESAQVLKGPQGTLFGRNTTGGAILLTPRKPGDTVGGDLMIGFGNYGQQEAEFGIDLPLADNFALRFAGRISDRDGYQTNVIPAQMDPGRLRGTKYGGGETRSGRLSMLWDVTDSVENYTILAWDEMDLNGPQGILQAVRPGSAVANNYTGDPQPSIFDALARARNSDGYDIETSRLLPSEVKAKSFINTTTIELGGSTTLKSILGYRDVEAFEILEVVPVGIPDINTGFQNMELEHASYELQLLGSALEDRLDWVTGLYWYHEDGFEHSPGNVFLAINPDNPFMQNSSMKNTSYSFFAQGSWHFSDQWSLTAGVRQTYDKKKMQIMNRTPNRCAMSGDDGQPLPLDNCVYKLSESFDQPTGTLSLEYKPDDATLFYLATRYGYRAGGFNVRASLPAETEAFDAETVLDLEGGIKVDWFLGDWSMRSNIALFQQWYDDIQRTVAVPNPFGVPGSTVQNAAKATVFGVEIEQTLSPTDNLSVTVQYAYTDPEYDNWVDPVSGVDLSGTPFSFTPKHKVTASIVYSYPLSGDAGVLDFGVSAAWQDDVWINSLQTSVHINAHPADIQHVLQQEAYWLVNTSATWRQVLGSALDISAYMKNATNEKYVTGGVLLYHSFGSSSKVFAEPRTYGVQMRYRF